MLFNSYSFIFIYLPIVLGGFLLFRFFHKSRLALSFLFLSSLVFYAYWDARFLLLLLISILFNYTAGRLLFTPFFEQKKKIILLTAVGEIYPFFFTTNILLSFYRF